MVITLERFEIGSSFWSQNARITEGLHSKRTVHGYFQLLILQ